MFRTRLSLGVGTKNTDRLGVFRHLGDETALPSGGPLLRRLDTPWTIRRCCNRPLHGRGHQKRDFVPSV